ncbi:MAG: hypothetical protein D3908_01465 [Candidatus Electrothrix sp. AUS4]|nr:hypothetical protein [Candidatus Electrothrix sp. AUS4]
MKFSISISCQDIVFCHTGKHVFCGFSYQLVFLLVLSFFTNSLVQKAKTKLFCPVIRQYQPGSPSAWSNIASFAVFSISSSQFSCLVQYIEEYLFVCSIEIGNFFVMFSVLQNVQKSNKQYGMVPSA